MSKKTKKGKKAEKDFLKKHRPSVREDLVGVLESIRPGGPVVREEGAEPIYGVSVASLYQDQQRADNAAMVAKREESTRYLVCCGHTTKRIRGGRRCQICHGFVAGEERA